MTALVASGCGDRCEALCEDVAGAIARCRSDALTWPDLGATNRRDFTATCKRDWDEVSGDLGARDLELALDVCAESRDDIVDLDCDEIIALYGTGD